MRNNPELFIYADLIGVELYAKSKSNPTWPEFIYLGECIDETKFTLHIRSKSTTKVYVKDQYLFQSWLPQPDGSRVLLQFDGAKLVGAPEQRIKLIRKKQHKKFH